MRVPDLRGQHVSLSYAAHEADSDDDYAEQEDYTAEKILAQRPNASAPGGLEFKVRLRGYGPSHDTWEPVSSFVPRVNTPFMEYIRKHKTKIHVSDLAALTRAIAAKGSLISALGSPLMQLERLCGRRIVPHLLALFHLSLTCHRSGHIPPPAESRGGWPHSFTSIRHSPPEAGSDPRGHLGVTWGVYLCAGKPPLADIILSHPPDLTRCDSVIGLVIAAMSGNIQYRGAASGDLYIGISGINRVLLS